MTTATPESYTLSLHDALPICAGERGGRVPDVGLRVVPVRPVSESLGGPAGPRRPVERVGRRASEGLRHRDRKSTRLNSSHSQISYAVFCLKKKNHKKPDSE